MSFATWRGMATHYVYTETKRTSLNYQKRWNMSRKLKRVEMDFSMTMPEPVEQVKAMEVVIMTVRMMIQTTFYPKADNRRSLPASTGVQLCPPGKEDAPLVSRETIVHN